MNPCSQNIGYHKRAPSAWLQETTSLIVRKEPEEDQRSSDLLRSDVNWQTVTSDPEPESCSTQAARTCEKKEDRFRCVDEADKRVRSEMMTHREVAMAVATRRADVGVGLTSIATETNLDSIPFAEEIYDFLVEKRLRNPYTRNFFDILRSKRFQKEIETSTRGITFLRETGRRIR